MSSEGKAEQLAEGGKGGEGEGEEGHKVILGGTGTQATQAR